MIRIDGLLKKYKKFTALDGISLEIPSGQVTAVIGPNGSGKTTLIKSILGLIRPDEGGIFIHDKPIEDDVSYKNNIGYIPQTAKYPENLTVLEVIEMISDLREYKGEPDFSLYESFKFDKEENKRIGALSGGNRQKLSAVIAFMFRPDWYILDEPSAGLDPVSNLHLKEKIFEEREKGKSFVLTSHIMSEIEDMATYVVLLIDGVIRHTGSMEEIKELAHEQKFEKAISRLISSQNESHN